MENYQFIRQIGHGNYGEIWLVKCSKTRNKHILKRIDLQQASKREQRAAHLEIKLLSTIKHPNIVTYIDSFRNSTGSLFIVMNYYECGDLHTYIKNQNGIYLEEKLIVHWFVQICLALKYLHDKNILHRNLKTKNIFLTKNQVIKVGDLGILKILSSTQEMCATLVETPYYVSPETFAGWSLSQKSDIWALGCCTYEMATLKHPYIAQDSYSLLQKIKKRKLPPIPDVYSFELFEMILSMLNQDPEKRPCVTKLLLNNHIRRYILLILQDNQKSLENISELSSARSKTSSELSSARSKSSSELSPHLSSNWSNGVLERSKSTFLLHNYTSKTPKICNISLKKNHDKTMIVSVPDVNGNGDGNDNSQHRGFKNLNPNNSEMHRTKYKYSDLVENASKYSFKLGNDSLKDTREKVSCDLPSYAKNLEKTINASEQKKKSEISFQILNNLAYCLHTARQKNFMDKNIGNTFETEQFGAHSQSSEKVKPTKLSVFQAEKVTKTATCNLKPVYKRKGQSNVCSLPQIK